MTRSDGIQRQLALLNQLRWFINLRWGAGAVVLAGALADWLWLGWYVPPAGILAVGAGILAYNAALRRLVAAADAGARPYPALVALACAQIVLDLACLTALTVWTGAAASPLLGCYVFHMVIASLLLPPSLAYAGAGASAAMLASALFLTGRWPADRQGLLVLVGWLVALLITVYLAGNITRKLRIHRLRLLRQKHRIRSMSDEIRRQKVAMMQQEKMAAMGQMAAGVAHEIANPLACMDSLLQLVQRRGQPLGAEAADKLRDQIARINGIVRQLTHFAHPSEAKWETVSVQEAVARAVQLVRLDRRVRDGQAAIEVQEPDTPARVKAQPRALEQVLVNILLNALDATADVPRPLVQVRCRHQNGDCIVEVSDNGHGIAPEHMAHLFEPFFTTKPVGRGTGLGLAISYKLVRMHGGQIEASSRGQGATFRVRLPEVSSSHN